MVLVIDSHTPVQRTKTIEKLCQDLGVEAQVVSSVLQAQPNLEKDLQLILLHCGDQPDAAEALNGMAGRFLVAYYGGWNPNDTAATYFATSPSHNHGLIQETVALGLEPDSDAAEKLKRCLQLILIQGHRPPEAVEQIYGDPKLEAILNELYAELVPRKDFKSLRDKREEQLGRYYLDRRGWCAISRS